MATTATLAPLQPQSEAPSIQVSQQESSNRGSDSRGGRGGDRGGHSHEGNSGGRGRGRGQRGNRGDGRGNQKDRRQHSAANQPAPPRPPPPGLGGGGTSSSRPTGDAEPKEGEVVVGGKPDEGHEEDVEAEVCFICASPVVHNSVAPCNHRTCHICALRLRALYKTRACAHCRTEAKFVIFTDDANKRYEDFVDGDFQETDEVLGIKYEQKEIHDDTVLLLRYNCPADDCDIACWGWPDLHRHVKSIHHKQLCDLCTRNKKVFTHEHELFTPQELRKHEKFGDDNPGAVDQSGFKGHPQCGFCVQRFYGDDELYAHCRDKHERCHICDRRNEGRQQQYYQDYNALEEHFRRDHFLCPDQECMEKKFVVFESEMDLQAHQLEAHPNGLTKDARRDARRVDISGFDYRAPHQESRGGRKDRGGRAGRGRGRDPNTEALPASTAQPMRRDEIAYQRQMAIQSAQSVTARTFGGQLTPAEPARPTGRSLDTVSVPSQRTVTNSSTPAIDSLNITSNPPSSPQPAQALTPQEQARRLQHASVMDRASTMLRNDATKIADFRSRVSSYRTSTITAPQLIDTFFTLFDVSSTELGKLIKELSDIYENDAKRAGLLKAWNDWRAINEDYPSLPGPSGVIPGSPAAAAGAGGRRVLKLKSSTAQSSRSAVSKQGSWGNIANGNTPFPPSTPRSSARGGAAASSSSSSNRGGGAHAPAWVAGSSSKPPSAPSSRPVSRPTTSHAPPARDAFPALPQATKPNTLMVGLTKGTVRWDDPRSLGPPAPAWGAGSSSGSGTGTPNGASGVEGDGEEGDSGLGGGKGKGREKKGKKQMLYKFG